jgi:hypothetical protein
MDIFVVGGSDGMAKLLSHLQHLQQLTYLDLHRSLLYVEASPPAAAYSVLTASSKLQHLDISYCTVPAGVWQQMFPAGRQLPCLKTLNIMCQQHGASQTALGPDGSLLVSCCPALQELDMCSPWPSADTCACMLVPLTKLGSLTKLRLRATRRQFGRVVSGD